MPRVLRKHLTHSVMGADTNPELLAGLIADRVARSPKVLLTTSRTCWPSSRAISRSWNTGSAKKAALRRLVQAVSHAVHRGARRAQCLIDVAPEQQFDPVKTDANELSVDVAHLLKLSVVDTIHVVTHLYDELWPAYVDPGQLQMAVLNLCLNARDAMVMGGELLIETANVKVMKGALEEIPPGRWVMIKVADTGVGMEPVFWKTRVSHSLPQRKSVMAPARFEPGTQFRLSIGWAL